jgi:P-type E1-E2 ATPase
MLLILHGISSQKEFQETKSQIEVLDSYSFAVSASGSSVLCKILLYLIANLNLFRNFVPISLLLTLEIVKLFQAIFISWDHSMFDTNQGIEAGVQASNLNEELGQIEFLFSDKTGTLTCNVMEFKKFSCGAFSYGTMRE